MMKVFVFDITKINDKMLDMASGVLSETEKNRLANMISIKRRKEFVLGHFLLRRLVCDIFNVPVEKAVVETLQTGALSLPLMENVYASISHSFERLAIAIGNTPVGFDIEKMAERENFPALLNQIDGMEKAKELVAAGMSVQNAFYRLWCKREALYKLKSQTEISAPFLYYKQYEDFMMCLACKDSVDVEWIFKNAEEYNV